MIVLYFSSHIIFEIKLARASCTYNPEYGYNIGTFYFLSKNVSISV